MRSLILAAVALLLAACIEAATVLVVSKPRGAAVLIDGEAVGKTPLRKSLVAGLHDIEISGKGYETQSETIEVKDQLLRYSVTLKPKTYPVDVLFKNVEESGWHVALGQRLFLTDEGALLSIPSTVRLPKGKHMLRLVKSGHRDFGVKVVVTAEEQAVVEIDTKSRKGYSSFQRLKIALVVGHWKRALPSRESFKFAANGTFKQLIGGKVIEGGKWSFLAAEVVTIGGVFRGGYRFTLKFTNADGKELLGKYGPLHVAHDKHSRLVAVAQLK